jgi:hypothetical protein
MARVQAGLFTNEATLDTVFRPNKRNPLVADGVVRVERAKFMDGLSLVSRANRSTYLGKCATCHEMCGLNVKASVGYPAKPGTVKQLTIFRNRK